MKENIYTTKKKYEIVYADPPWRFQTYSEKGKGRSSERHYPTMAKEEIQRLPIERICADNCVLLLWITAPCLIEGMELTRAWEFTYKTVAFTWIKQNKRNDRLFMGMGYYTRSNAEFCLLATRGKILQRQSRSVPSVILSHIERHSQKPKEARERIVKLFGDRPRIELFARDLADVWDCWGNEI